MKQDLGKDLSGGIYNLRKTLLERCLENVDKAKAQPPLKDGYFLEFRINGIDVPFLEALQEFESWVHEEIKETAEQIARDRLASATETFDDFAEDLHAMFEERIVQKLSEKLFEVVSAETGVGESPGE